MAKVERHVVEPERRTEVSLECDVLVTGGGIAGIAAALAAAPLASAALEEVQILGVVHDAHGVGLAVGDAVGKPDVHPRPRARTSCKSSGPEAICAPLRVEASVNTSGPQVACSLWYTRKGTGSATWVRSATGVA